MQCMIALLFHAARCEDGEIRLFGGSTKSMGGVEICIREHWFIIAGGSGIWSDPEATVTCKQLGYSRGKQVAMS